MNPTAVTQSYLDQLQARIRAARAHTDELFEIVRSEALYDRPIPERHRIIFYLGHLEAFDWNLLLEPLGLASFNADFDRLFAFGIDPVEGGLPDDQPKDWPSLEKVRHYAAQLRRTLDDGLRNAAADDPGLVRLEHDRLLDVAIEHRLMHAETLCYMLHQLPVERKFSRPALPPPPTPSCVPRKVEIPAGIATLGMRRSENGTFGWDNEFEEQRVEVPAFAMDAYNVTNLEYLRFVLDGGYRDRSLWSDAGWDCISSEGRAHPIFWVRRGDSWACRRIAERSRVASRSLRRSRWLRARVSLGCGATLTAPWQFRFAALGSHTCRIISRRVERIRRCRPGRKRVGMDAHILRAVSRVRTVFLLSRLLGELFRRETLRDERRFAAHGLVHAAAVVSQLVPAALPIRLRDLPLR